MQLYKFTQIFESAITTELTDISHKSLSREAAKDWHSVRRAQTASPKHSIGSVLQNVQDMYEKCTGALGCFTDELVITNCGLACT